MKPKKYLVTLRCGVLMTHKTIEVEATSEDQISDIVRETAPYSFIVKVQEIESK